MKIVFTGGGTGGHFYPIIAVVSELRKIVKEQGLVEPQLFFISPDPYDKNLLLDNNLVYKRVISGKYRRYFSFLNFTDLIKIFFGFLKAFWVLLWIYPDVIFSKGGFGSVPVVMAGRVLGIPIIIHESDTKPGKANIFAGKFAKKIAISNSETAEYFKGKNVALTGVPIRKEILFKSDRFEAARNLGLNPEMKTILVLGGSQGAVKINDTIIEILSRLLSTYQVIHVAGKNNYEATVLTAGEVLKDDPNKANYFVRDYLSTQEMKDSAGVADLIITRAGSTALAEISNWQVPSIVIPIPEEVSHDQRYNAYAYARKKACTVIEENNLTNQLLFSEIEKIFADPALQEEMINGAKEFSIPDSARIIAKELLEIVLEHEKNV